MDDDKDLKEKNFKDMTEEELLSSYLDIKKDQLELANAVHIFERKIQELESELEIAKFKEGIEND